MIVHPRAMPRTICTGNTSPNGHPRTFSRCARLRTPDVITRLAQVSRKVIPSLVMSLLNVPSTPFPPIFPSLTASLTPPTASLSPLTGIRLNPRATPLWGGPSGAKRTTSYLMSHPGYPPVLEAIRPQHRQGRICFQQVQPKSEVTNLLHEGSADHPHKPKTKTKKWDGNRDSDNHLRDLPEWVEEFIDNLEDTELHASAHSSLESDLEYPATVPTKSRKHSINTQFPRDRDCDECLRTKMSRAPCRRSTGEALPRAEKFGDLITADHKVLNEEGESRDNHRRCRCSRSGQSMDSILSV